MLRRKFNSPRRFEKLEDRQMMAADIDLDNGVLTITGTASNESLVVATDPSDSDDVLVTIWNNDTLEVVAQEDYDYDDIDELVVNGLDGNDYLENYTDIRARLYGGNGDDLLSSGAGNDLLDGAAGDDRLIGGKGNDQLQGGVDNDIYYFFHGQLGSDVVVENAAQDFDHLDFFGLNGPVSIDLSNTAEQVVNPDHLTLRLSTESGIESVIGSRFDDVIRGNSRANLLQGTDGRDVLFGGLGDDTLLGDNGDDFLYGEYGTDTLDGGYGDDRLDGGLDYRQDRLKGDAGRDTFVIHRRRFGREPVDQMLDFVVGVDLVFTTWH